MYVHDTCSMFKLTNVPLSDEEAVKNTHAAARHSVYLQRYFVKQSVSDASNAAIDMWADEVFRRANVKLRQTTPHSFKLRCNELVHVYYMCESNCCNKCLAMSRPQ